MEDELLNTKRNIIRYKKVDNERRIKLLELVINPLK